MNNETNKKPARAKNSTGISDYLPDSYTDFIKRYPEIGKYYDKLAGICHESGPLDPKMRRLTKLGIAIGGNSEGAVRSHTRRAPQEGISADEIRHVVLLAFTTVGFPSMIAAYKWVEEVLEKAK
jgi:4-carboxymuconolactone decarboxylase